MSNFRDVLEFHQAFSMHVGQRPAVPPAHVVKLRLALLQEEFNELCAAIGAESLPSIAGEIADMVYVLLGTAASYGIDFDTVWSEVHMSNMRKVGGTMRSDGKVLKPKGWQPPNLRKLLEGSP